MKLIKFISLILLLILCTGCTKKTTNSLDNGSAADKITLPDNKIDSSIKNYKLYVIAPNGLNLRSEPNTTSERIKLLPQNTELTILERSEEKETIDGIHDYWYKINTGNKIGWVFGGYLNDIPIYILVENNNYIAEVYDMNGTWIPDWYNRIGVNYEIEEKLFSWGVANSAIYTSFDIDITSENSFIYPPAIRPFLITNIIPYNNHSFILHANYSYDQPPDENSYFEILLSFIDKNKICIKTDNLKLLFTEGDSSTNPYDGFEVWHRLSAPNEKKKFNN